MANVLITDPDQRAALAAVRSIARQGHRVSVLGTTRGLAGWSLSTDRFYRLAADDRADPARLVQAVRKAVRQGNVDVVLPVTDAASKALLGLGSDIGAIVAGPTREAYMRASDKEALLSVAPSIGIRVPRQYVVANLEEALALIPDFPDGTVLKPAKSIVYEKTGRMVRVGVRFASTEDSYRSAVCAYPDEAYPLLVQERIAGTGTGVFLLRVRGRTLLNFGHRRLREKPPAGGVSTYREAVDPQKDLVVACERLLDHLEYEGPAMIEFKEQDATGASYLMEINARLWGSVQLAIDAGADFPAALINHSLGIPIPDTSPTRLGVRSAWELGELDHMLFLLRRSAAELHLPEETPVGLGAAVRVLFDRRWTDRAEVFRWGDPVPFVAETCAWLKG